MSEKMSISLIFPLKSVKDTFAPALAPFTLSLRSVLFYRSLNFFGVCVNNEPEGQLNRGAGTERLTGLEDI